MLGGRGLPPAKQSLSWEENKCNQKKTGFGVGAAACHLSSGDIVQIVADSKNFVVISPSPASHPPPPGSKHKYRGTREIALEFSVGFFFSPWFKSQIPWHKGDHP